MKWCCLPFSSQCFGLFPGPRSLLCCLAALLQAVVVAAAAGPSQVGAAQGGRAGGLGGDQSVPAPEWGHLPGACEQSQACWAGTPIKHGAGAGKGL